MIANCEKWTYLNGKLKCILYIINVEVTIMIGITETSLMLFWHDQLKHSVSRNHYNVQYQSSEVIKRYIYGFGIMFHEADHCLLVL